MADALDPRAAGPLVPPGTTAGPASATPPTIVPAQTTAAAALGAAGQDQGGPDTHGTIHSTTDRAGGPRFGAPDGGAPGGAPGRTPGPRKRRGRRGWLGRGTAVVLLLLATVVFVYPLVWLVSASFKPRSEVFDNKLIPANPTIANYLDIWAEAPLALWMGNTVFVTVLAAATVTLSSSLVAWGFSYYRFRGRDALFFLVLATMMLPGAVTMIPTFLIWDALGQVGTLTPLWAGNLFGSAFYIFLLRQFFLGLPRQTFEAAKIDGASDWQIFRHMALPLCKPALVVTLLFEAQAAWTDLMRPLIYLRDANTFTVPRGLKAMLDQFGFAGNWHWELIITAGVITTVPMIILFFIGQRHFIEGVATTGTKG